MMDNILRRNGLDRAAFAHPSLTLSWCDAPFDPALKLRRYCYVAGDLGPEIYAKEDTGGEFIPHEDDWSWEIIMRGTKFHWGM